MMKPCEVCGEEFNGTSRSKYCKIKHEKECDRCGSPFTLSIRSWKTGRNTCDACSRVKAGEAHSVTLRKKLERGEKIGFARPEVQAAATVSKKFGPLYKSLSLTQQEYMNSIGYYRINDAGSKLFTWEPS